MFNRSSKQDKNNGIVMSGIIKAVIYLVIVIALIFSIVETIKGEEYIWMIVVLLAILILFIFWDLMNGKTINQRMENRLYSIIGYLDRSNSDYAEENIENEIDSKKAALFLSNDDKLKEKIDQYIDKIKGLNMLKKQAEYNAHQSQIDPHFLYNTLDTIRGKAYESGQTEVDEMIEALSRVFRYSLSNKNDMLRIQDEIDNVKDYISIQQLRFGNRFSFSCNVDESDWRLLQFKIPKLILQPLIENSITHGFEKAVDKGEVKLKVYRTENQVIIRVEDNGAGIPEEKMLSIINQLNKDINTTDKDDNVGIALRNINQRIRYIYGAKYGLCISSIEGYGTTTEIVMPYTEG